MHRKSIYGLLLAVTVLIVIGCVMLFSTSAFANEKGKSPEYFIKHQSTWLAIGLFLCAVVAKTDYLHWRRVAWPLYGAAAVLLALCFVPHVGMKLNGAHRWLNLGFASFQPSEFAKLAVVVVIARWFTQKDFEPARFVQGFLVPLCIAGGLMGLIVFEVDMGSTALIGAAAIGVMFIAGTRISYIAPMFIAGLSLMFYIAHHMPERLHRILAFQNLEEFKEGAGLQQYQGLIAFGSGGVNGLGLGMGRQKMAYLPYAHTDFIFPMVGEELGLRFTLLVVFCFLVIVVCGAMISLRARDRFGMLLGFGVVLLISLQAAVNIGVTTALLPNKGMPLPFISYGGSNLAFCLVCVGILINIYRRGLTEKEVNRGSAKLEVKTRKRMVRI
ncbi:MAG: putative lipid II flippase FtsW [Chthoniobacteraceae bacterium]